MSIMICERHDIEYDSDFIEECKYCLEEHLEDNSYEVSVGK